MDCIPAINLKELIRVFNLCLWDGILRTSFRNFMCVTCTDSSVATELYSMFRYIVIERKYEIKVKVTLVQALRLCTGRTAHRGSRDIYLLFHRDIYLLFHDHGTRRGWGVSVTPLPLFTPWKDPIPIVQEAGWAPGPVWTGAENLDTSGIRSPDRPARNQSLYRLRYPAHVTSYSFIHLVVRLTTGPKPLPKRVLHTVRSRAFSFKWEYPLLSLRSSNSFVRLLPCLPVTSIPPCIFPSVTRCWRQFLRKMWPEPGIN
jgi:hypothetical protein